MLCELLNKFFRSAYTESVLKKFGMENAKFSPTPVDPSNKFVKATESR